MSIVSHAPHYPLYRRSRTPVWLALSWRALLDVSLIGVALAVHWFDWGGLRQSSGAPAAFADILLRAADDPARFLVDLQRNVHLDPPPRSVPVQPQFLVPTGEAAARQPHPQDVVVELGELRPAFPAPGAEQGRVPSLGVEHHAIVAPEQRRGDGDRSMVP